MKSFYQTMLIVEANTNPHAAFVAIPELINKFEKLVAELEGLLGSDAKQSASPKSAPVPVSAVPTPPQSAPTPVPDKAKWPSGLNNYFTRRPKTESFQESFYKFNVKLKIIQESVVLCESAFQQEITRITSELRQLVGQLKSNFETVQDFNSMLSSAMQQQLQGLQGNLTQGMQQSFKDVLKGSKQVSKEQLMYHIADLTRAIDAYSPDGSKRWIRIIPSLKGVGNVKQGIVDIPYDDADAQDVLAQKAIKSGNFIWRLKINKPSAVDRDYYEVDMTEEKAVLDAIEWIKHTASARYEKYLLNQRNV